MQCKHTLHNATLFYKIRPSICLSPLVLYLNECTYCQTLSTVWRA